MLSGAEAPSVSSMESQTGGDGQEGERVHSERVMHKHKGGPSLAVTDVETHVDTANPLIPYTGMPNIPIYSTTSGKVSDQLHPHLHRLCICAQVTHATCAS